MSPAEPRRNAKGVAAILPTRIGVSPGIRPRPDSSTAVTASGREPSGSKAACALRGTLSRSALPSSLGDPSTGHVAKPRTPGSLRPAPIPASVIPTASPVHTHAHTCVRPNINSR